MNATFFYSCGLVRSIFVLKVFRYHDYLTWLSSIIWSSTSYSVVLNLMPDTIASFPFEYLEGGEPKKNPMNRK